MYYIDLWMSVCPYSVTFVISEYLNSYYSQDVLISKCRAVLGFFFCIFVFIYWFIYFSFLLLFIYLFLLSLSLFLSVMVYERDVLVYFQQDHFISQVIEFRCRFFFFLFFLIHPSSLHFSLVLSVLVCEVPSVHCVWESLNSLFSSITLIHRIWKLSEFVFPFHSFCSSYVKAS